MIVRIGVICLLLTASVACRTVPPPPEEPRGEPRVKRQFQPTQIVSMLKFGEGNYVNLYSGESYAVWVDQEVMNLKRAEAGMDVPAGAANVPLSEDFIILECHIATEFNDMSIAYDVVRNRGVDVYLVAPDGKKVPPLQMRMLGPVKQESIEALKRFESTHIAIFPRENLWVGAPIGGVAPMGVRLVFETHNSAFYFEWPGALSEEVRKTPLSLSDRSRAVRLGFNEFYGHVRGFVHNFD